MQMSHNQRSNTLVESASRGNPIERDSLGRPHYRRPMSGKASLMVRTAKHHNLSVTSHCRDLHPRISQDRQEGKSVVLLAVDGGPDLSVKHQTNVYQYGLLWKEMNLEAMIVYDYGPYQSAMNPIERIWAPVTKSLSGVIFHDKVRIDNDNPTRPPMFESLPPHQQTELQPNVLEQKEKKIFDTAMRECTQIISQHAVYGNESVLCNFVECFSVEEKSDKDTYESMFLFTKAPLYDLKSKKNQDHIAAFAFVCKHLVRQHNVITFCVCKNPSCSHCTKFTNTSRATKCLQEYGYRLPNPEYSTTHKDHYMTFIELESKYKGKRDLPKLDKNQPSQEDLGKCNLKGCRNFRFFSISDKDRHLRLLHGGKRAIKESSLPTAIENPKIGKPKSRVTKKIKSVTVHKCQFPHCGIIFGTYHQLREHKIKEKHMVRRGRKSK